MKRVVYTNSEGTLCVVIPSKEFEDKIEEVIATSVPAGVDFEVVEHTDIPSDRRLRDAWELSPQRKVGINRIKAENFVKDRVRAERAPMLEALDVEYMRALESGDSALASTVASNKQILRDVTAKDLSVMTDEELAGADLDGVLKL